MDLQNINVVEIVKIDNVELYQTQNGQGHLVTQGPLIVLYAKDYDWFILRLNDFNYGLSKNVPVLGSSHEKGANRAYVLPNTDGHYILKIGKVQRWQDLDSLENIFRHNTEFAEKEGPEGKGQLIEVHDKKLHVQFASDTIKKEGGYDPTQMLYNGGKAAKQAIVKSAEAISTGMSKFGSFMKTNVLTNPKTALIDESHVKRVEFLNKASNMVSSITSPFVRGFRFVTGKVQKNLESKLEHKPGDIEGGSSNPASNAHIGHAALHSAISVWQGMAEALDIIREGVTDTTTDLVAHQYGARAGDVCKSTIGIATNIGIGKKLFKTK